MTTSAQLNSFTPDAETSFGALGTAQTFTANGTLQASGSDAVLDLGEGAAIQPNFVVDVSDLDTASGNETYTVEIDLASDSGFTADVITYSLTITRTGRYLLPVSNLAPDANGIAEALRYARCRVVVGGTTPSISLAVYGTRSPKFS